MIELNRQGRSSAELFALDLKDGMPVVMQQRDADGQSHLLKGIVSMPNPNSPTFDVIPRTNINGKPMGNIHTLSWADITKPDNDNVRFFGRA